jgi:outer membrane lipoprotein carrier protein
MTTSKGKRGNEWFYLCSSSAAKQSFVLTLYHAHMNEPSSKPFRTAKNAFSSPQCRPPRFPFAARLTLEDMLRPSCLALIFLSSALLPAATTTDELIRRVETRYNAARTLSVEFVENYNMQGHPRPPETGTLTLRKERKMRWDYVHPAGKLFISDGKTAYLYTAGENRVEKMPLKNTEDMRAPLAFLLGRLDMKKEFRDFSTHLGDGGASWLVARSKTDRTPYDNIEMLIASDGAIQELKIAGRDQSLLAFSFKAERLNPPLNDNLFHFDIPAGADVVDSVAWDGQGK